MSNGYSKRCQLSLWRNWLARSAVNRKVGGSSPPRDAVFFVLCIKKIHFVRNVNRLFFLSEAQESGLEAKTKNKRALVHTQFRVFATKVHIVSEIVIEFLLI